MISVSCCLKTVQIRISSDSIEEEVMSIIGRGVLSKFKVDADIR